MFIIFLICSFLLASVEAGPCLEPCSTNLCPMRIGVRHIENKGIGYSTGYTTLEAFLSSPQHQYPVMPFVDLRGHVFDNGRLAGNAGIGARAALSNVIYGGYVYYDFRDTSQHTYNQVSFGVEALSKWIDVRVNGYLPTGTKISAPYDYKFLGFSGHTASIKEKIQYTFKGANGEVGFHLPCICRLDSYIAAGPYYLKGEICSDLWGVQARLHGLFNNCLSFDLIYSYDKVFKNIVQGQVGLSFSFGGRSKKKKTDKKCYPSKLLMNNRLLAPVNKFEIIPITTACKTCPAINPETNRPYYFVFVDNTSNSNGTYESPYPSFGQAQAASAPNDIIYVYPGDGTTKGMDAGITLKENQKLWGSGVNHLLQTPVGTFSISAQSKTDPIITNTDIDTEGNAITLASNNAISGFIISSPLNDAIYGAASEKLDVSCCIFENTTTFPIEATFPGSALVSITNNQFINNVNGVFLTLNETSALICSCNTFNGQTSVSNIPIEIVANNNIISTQILNNVFNNNTTGSVRIALTDVLDASITLLNNRITNNGTGSQSTLGSSIVILPTGTIDNCTIRLTGNTISANTSNSLYVHTSGAFNTLSIQASRNIITNNGGSAIVFGSASDTFNLNVTNNFMANLNDNAISTVGASPFDTANISIRNNTIIDINNGQTGIAMAQASALLNFTAQNNTIANCQGSGIFFFSTEFTELNANITGNTITNCQNLQGNAASALSIDTYVNLTANIANNTLTNNLSPPVGVGLFTSDDPSVCLNLIGNNSNVDPSYSLTNPGNGPFYLSPCNVGTVNVGQITTSGVITPVQSCTQGTPCPP